MFIRFSALVVRVHGARGHGAVCDGAMQDVRELAGAKGFVEVMADAEGRELGVGSLASAGDQDHRKFGPQPADLLREVDAGHAGHVGIGDDGVEAVGVGVEREERVAHG